MRVFEAFETSARLINEGVTCEIEFGGKVIARVWCRPADQTLNADFRRELAEGALALRQGGVDNIESDLDQELLHRVYVRAVILKWEWTSPDDIRDPALQFNEKNALALFKRVPKFFEAIQIAARRWTNFRLEFEEDAAGNSSTSSITGSGSGTKKSRTPSPQPTENAD